MGVPGFPGTGRVSIAKPIDPIFRARASTSASPSLKGKERPKVPPPDDQDESAIKPRRSIKHTPTTRNPNAQKQTSPSRSVRGRERAKRCSQGMPGAARGPANQTTTIPSPHQTQQPTPNHSPSFKSQKSQFRQHPNQTIKPTHHRSTLIRHKHPPLPLCGSGAIPRIPPKTPTKPPANPTHTPSFQSFQILHILVQTQPIVAAR